MFFGNTKLKKELEEKELLINKLRTDIQNLKAKHKDKLKLLREDLVETTQKLSGLEHEYQEYLNKVEESTNIDIMSGANNKRYFYDVVESMISLSKRQKSALSVAVIDIDDFEWIEHSQVESKDILQCIVSNISCQIRESDTFVRLEKGKFVLVFPQTSLEQAKFVCHKLERSIVDKPIIDDFYVKLSIGVAEFSENENINSVLKRAEEFLKVS